MRRLITTLAALAAVAGPLVVADAAAQPGRARGQGQAQRQIERGAGPQAPSRGLVRGRSQEGPPGLARGLRERGNERAERLPAPRFIPAPAYGDAAPREGIRRGGMLPPDYRGAPVYDPGRYRLRPPPPGYAWYRVGDDFLLVSQMSGLIFDVVSP